MNKRGQTEGCVPLWQRRTCKNWGSKRWLWCLEQRVQWSERKRVGKAYHELGSRSQSLFHVNLVADALSTKSPCVLHPHVKLQGTQYRTIAKSPQEGSQLYSAGVYLFHQGILGTNSIQKDHPTSVTLLTCSGYPLNWSSTPLGPDPQSFLCILLNFHSETAKLL